MGPSDSAGGISPVLRMVEDLPIISNSACNDVYGIVGSGVVCIDTTGGKGTCNGDSGGPLSMKSEVTKAGQQWKQVGMSPSVPLLVVKLDTQLVSPGLNTTWTGSCLRLE